MEKESRLLLALLRIVVKKADEIISAEVDEKNLMVVCFPLYGLNLDVGGQTNGSIN